MSAPYGKFLACIAVFGGILGSAATDAYSKPPTTQNAVGVWHCDIGSPVGLPPFRAVLAFSRDGNISIIGSNDDDGLIVDPDVMPAQFATSKTPAYGRWTQKNRRKVQFTSLYYDTNGLQSGDNSGVDSNITRLNCTALPGRSRLTGSCSADIFLADADPIDGDPIIPAAGPILEASCKRLTAD